MLLEKVEALTLQEDELTTGRRSSPVKQLTCLSGCRDVFPSTVLCKNKGSDGVDVNWACEADLPDGLSFGTMDVSCEGFDYPDDPYILRGSCGLAFSLKGKVRRASGNTNYGGSAGGSAYKHDYDTSYSSTSSGSSWGTWLMYGIIMIIVYTIFKAFFRRTDSGGGGGGGGGPPPYQPPGFGSGNQGGYGSGYGSGGYSGPDCSAPPPPPQNNGFFGGNFWSGIAAGSLLSWLTRSNSGYGYGSGYANRYEPNQYGGSSSMFNNMGYGARRVQRTNQFARAGGFRSNAAGAAATTRRTGFASTSRR